MLFYSNKKDVWTLLSISGINLQGECYQTDNKNYRIRNDAAI